jgi:hypothetical protein
MKYYLLTVGFFLVLGMSACISSKSIMISPTLSLGRIASDETRFADPVTCEVAATAYYKGTGHLDKPSRESTKQVVYSFRKGKGFQKKSEVRFIVDPAAPPTGRSISYYEIPAVSATDDALNENAIQKFVEGLVSAGDATVLEPKALDEKVNGKRAWRVLLRATKVLGDKSNKRYQVTSDFGIIINPPYPP